MLRLLIIIISTLLSVNLFAGEFAVSPLVINVDGPKNKRLPFEFTIKAKSAGDVSLQVYDLKQIETGHMGFVLGEESDKNSKASWIRLKDNKFSIKTDDFVVAKGDIRIPSKAKGQHLAAIMVEEAKKESDKKGIDVKVRYAVVLKIDTRNGKVKKYRTKTMFDGLSYKKVENGWEFEGYFQNLSKVEGNLVTEMQIRNTNRKLIGKVELKTLSAWQRSEQHSMVYPGSRVRIFGTLNEDLDLGTYQIRVKNRFNDRNQPVFKHDLTLDSKSLDQANGEGNAGS